MADQQISISLPEEAIRSMQARVDAGEYASISALIASEVGCVSLRSDEELNPMADTTPSDLEAELQESVRLFHEAEEPFEDLLTLEQMKAVLDEDLQRMKEAA